MNIKKQQRTTLVQRACANVKGFNALHKRLEKKIIVSGKSMSTLFNCMRCTTHIDLKYNCLPTQLNLEPRGLVRIRHYGILSSSRKQLILPLLRQQSESRYEFPEDNNWKQISMERLGYNPDACPVCKQLTMITIFTFDRRGPPDGKMMKVLIEKHQCKQASSRLMLSNCFEQIVAMNGSKTYNHTDDQTEKAVSCFKLRVYSIQGYTHR